MGLKFNSLIVSWQGALPGLLAGKYDVLFQTMDITPDRQKNVLFVDAWLESGGRLVVHRDSPIKSVEDVKGKVIGVSSGSSWAKLAEPLGARELKYYETDIPAMLDVANMRTDAMICDQILAAYAIQERGLPLKMVGEYLTVVQKGWATRNHAVNLVKAMNKALASVIADGTYDKIAMKYVGLSPRPKSPIRSQLPN
jgi:polar amino acid transport system substrate-binding protein